jgi:hypothetical protein
MKTRKLYFVSLLAIVIGSYITLSVGEGNKREWITTACQHFDLTVRDNSSNTVFFAKYVVTASNGMTFVSERKATDEDSARVVFPDSFHEVRTNQKAWVNCAYGEKYKWEIYVNDILIESGAISLTRNKQK